MLILGLGLVTWMFVIPSMALEFHGIYDFKVNDKFALLEGSSIARQVNPTHMDNQYSCIFRSMHLIIAQSI